MDHATIVIPVYACPCCERVGEVRTRPCGWSGCNPVDWIRISLDDALHIPKVTDAIQLPSFKDVHGYAQLDLTVTWHVSSHIDNNNNNNTIECVLANARGAWHVWFTTRYTHVNKFAYSTTMPMSMGIQLEHSFIYVDRWSSVGHCFPQTSIAIRRILAPLVQAAAVWRGTSNLLMTVTEHWLPDVQIAGPWPEVRYLTVDDKRSRPWIATHRMYTPFNMELQHSAFPHAQAVSIHENAAQLTCTGRWPVVLMYHRSQETNTVIRGAQHVMVMRDTPWGMSLDYIRCGRALRKLSLYTTHVCYLSLFDCLNRHPRLHTLELIACDSDWSPRLMDTICHCGPAYIDVHIQEPDGARAHALCDARAARMDVHTTRSGTVHIRSMAMSVRLKSVYTVAWMWRRRR